MKKKTTLYRLIFFWHNWVEFTWYHNIICNKKELIVQFCPQKFFINTMPEYQKWSSSNYCKVSHMPLLKERCLMARIIMIELMSMNHPAFFFFSCKDICCGQSSTTTINCYSTIEVSNRDWRGFRKIPNRFPAHAIHASFFWFYFNFRLTRVFLLRCFVDEYRKKKFLPLIDL